eukprot:scaffold256162_cov48-Prasinocladus_malaysianus.AAC.3
MTDCDEKVYIALSHMHCLAAQFPTSQGATSLCTVIGKAIKLDKSLGLEIGLQGTRTFYETFGEMAFAASVGIGKKHPSILVECQPSQLSSRKVRNIWKTSTELVATSTHLHYSGFTVQFTNAQETAWKKYVPFEIHWHCSPEDDCVDAGRNILNHPLTFYKSKGKGGGHSDLVVICQRAGHEMKELGVDDRSQGDTNCYNICQKTEDSHTQRPRAASSSIPIENLPSRLLTEWLNRCNKRELKADIC